MHFSVFEPPNSDFFKVPQASAPPLAPTRLLTRSKKRAGPTRFPLRSLTFVFSVLPLVSKGYNNFTEDGVLWILPAALRLPSLYHKLLMSFRAPSVLLVFSAFAPSCIRSSAGKPLFHPSPLFFFSSPTNKFHRSGSSACLIIGGFSKLLVWH